MTVPYHQPSSSVSSVCKSETDHLLSISSGDQEGVYKDETTQHLASTTERDILAFLTSTTSLSGQTPTTIPSDIGLLMGRIIGTKFTYDPIDTSSGAPIH